MCHFEKCHFYFPTFSTNLKATFLEAVKIKLYNSVAATAQNFLALGYQKLGKSFASRVALGF